MQITICDPSVNKGQGQLHFEMNITDCFLLILENVVSDNNCKETKKEKEFCTINLRKTYELC